MDHEHRRRAGAAAAGAGYGAGTPGKRTLTEARYGQRPTPPRGSPTVAAPIDDAAKPDPAATTFLEDFPAADRQRLSFGTQTAAAPPPPPTTGMTVTFRPGDPVELAPAIPAALAPMLTQAIGRFQHIQALQADTAVDRALAIPAAEAAVLAPTATAATTGTLPGAAPTDVALVFRFTSIEHPGPAAAPTRRDPHPLAAGRRILVEYLGPDTPLAAANAALPAGLSPADGGTVPGPVAVTVVGPWTAPQLQTLQETIALLPAGLRAHIPTLRFRVFNHGGGEAASFVPAGARVGGMIIDPTHDAIVIQTSAFANDAGDGRVGTHRPSVMTLAHELGHRLDALEARRTRAVAERIITTPRQTPLTLAQARAALVGVHDFSGTRERVTTIDHGDVNTQHDEDTRNTTDSAFRAAAVADGTQLAPLTPRTPDQQQRDADRGYTPTADRTGGLTSYSDEAWAEYFAEAFALFVTDPSTLRALRPHVHAYFTTRSIPAPSAANTPAVPATGGGGGTGTNSLNGLLDDLPD